MSLKNKNKKIISGCSYNDFPDLYDFFYLRYLKTIPRFVSLVARYTPLHGEILDLAAGTGEVSIPLIKSGFKVTSLDLSSGMLSVLKKKCRAHKLRCQSVNKDILDINYEKKFDTVCIRQAINYLLGTKELERGFKKINTSLKDGGHFIFNSPVYKKNRNNYPIVENHYEDDEKKALVIETNKVKNNLLVHRQDALLWHKDAGHIYHFIDRNSFYMFTKKEFTSTLSESGFSKIIFLSEELTPFNKQSKSLYIIAKK